MKVVKPILIISVLLLITYFYPRWLISMWGEADPWTSYFYQYGFGFLMTAIGIILIVKARSLVFGRGSDTLWFVVLVSGFFFYLALHGFWIYFALNTPFLGGQ